MTTSAHAVTWSGSLHQTFRLIPAPSESLRPFLSSEGLTELEVLGLLPYASARSTGTSGTPDRKRYRDARSVYQSVGLLYETPNGQLVITELGKATLRWLDVLSVKNAAVLGRHAALALAACQVRNPTRPGQQYASSVEVFPFSYIWRAMLELDDRISSDELNQAIFHTTDERSLEKAIQQIRDFREDPDAHPLGSAVITGARRNDRIVPWISLASFGYLLIADKRDSPEGYYTIRPEVRSTLHEASMLRHKHRQFGSTQEYVEYISASACLPVDVR